MIVTTCARSARRRSVSPHRVSGLAADAGIDLVEDHGFAAADRGDRECDPRELAARGGLRNRRERKAGVRSDEEADGVAPGGALRCRLELDPKLAFAETDALELLGNRGCEGLDGLSLAFRSPPDSFSTRLSASASAAAAAASGSAPPSTAASSRLASAARSSSSSYVVQRKRRFVSAMRSSSTSICSTRSGSASSEARKPRRSDAASRRRISMSRSSLADRSSSGARFSIGASARSA